MDKEALIIQKLQVARTDGNRAFFERRRDSLKRRILETQAALEKYRADLAYVESRYENFEDIEAGLLRELRKVREEKHAKKIEQLQQLVLKLERSKE